MDDAPAPQDLDALRRRLGADPETTALLFDFDGTLAPIVADPSAAAAVEGVTEVLDLLVERFACIAVVSGRPRSFLLDHIGPGVDLSGLYGLETRVAGLLAEHPDAGGWRAVITEAVDDARAALPEGVVVEAKGLSLTLHHRTAPDAGAAVGEWAAAVSDRTGLEVRSAKQSVELHPPVAVDKGTSVEAFSEGCERVAYFGDDVGDLPAYAALGRLRARGVDAIGVAVGSDELPASVAAAADVVLEGPDAVLELLGPLAR